MIYGIWKDSRILAAFVVPMTVRSNHPVFLADTLSLKRTVRQRTAQRWEIDTKLSPLSVDAQELMTHFITNGHSQVFDAVMPQNVGAKAARTTTAVLLTAATEAFESQVVVSGSGTAGTKIPMGTFIRFSGHNKVYMTTEDAVFTGASTVISMYPQLVKPVAAGETVKYQDDVVMRAYYDTDTVIGMAYEDGILMDNGAVKLVEAL
jgi:hypothetical protein